jgi:hypothetical protein
MKLTARVLPARLSAEAQGSPMPDNTAAKAAWYFFGLPRFVPPAAFLRACEGFFAMNLTGFPFMAAYRVFPQLVSR